MVRFHLPGRARSTLLALAAMSTACFSGSAALGLPCEQQSDCGLDQSCVDGFCGGPQDDTGTGTGTGGPVCGDGVVDDMEQCDEGGANSPEGDCTPECTTNVCGDGYLASSEDCDEGPDNADDAACKSDCTLNICGDGFVGPGEGCDEGDDNADDGTCRPDCTAAACGDSVIAPGEDCDDGGESATCDTDCTAAECGDGLHNASAGEACDGGDMCLADCRAIYFFDDMEDGMGEWTQQVVNGSLSETWTLSQTRPESGQTSWYSGVPQEMDGSLRLVSPEIDLSSATSPIVLTVQHWYEFDDCDASMTRGDGAILEIGVADVWQTADPIVPYPHPLDTATCGMAGNNPLAPGPAWAWDSGGTYREVEVDLEDYIGQTIQVGFHVAYDCGNCEMSEGWYVDDLLVAGY